MNSYVDQLLDILKKKEIQQKCESVYKPTIDYTMSKVKPYLIAVVVFFILLLLTIVIILGLLMYIIGKLHVVSSSIQMRYLDGCI